MSKLTASFLGPDCPGEVSAIAGLLGENGCNIEAVSQAMVSGEFTAIFVVSAPEGVEPGKLQDLLQEGLRKAEVDLSVMVRPATGAAWGEGKTCEPFVVTVDGPDGVGLIGAMSRVFTRHGVNIEHLSAILGQMSPDNALFVFEVMVPEDVDIGRLRRELALEAKKLDLRVSVQHRDIFEAVHRINNI